VSEVSHDASGPGPYPRQQGAPVDGVDHPTSSPVDQPQPQPTEPPSASAEPPAATPPVPPPVPPPGAGPPVSGPPATGRPGQPTSSEPGHGQPIYGQPIYGQPGYGEPPYGQPSYGQSISGPPTSGPPTSGQPASGLPSLGPPTWGPPSLGQPYGGDPAPPVNGPHPYPAPFARAGDVAGPPSGHDPRFDRGPSPVSGPGLIPEPRFGESPISGVPQHSVSGPPDPIFGDQRPSWEPRIVPSPPPQRSRLIVGALAGLVAGLLIFGATGFFAGRATAPKAAPASAPAPTPTPTLSLFEQAQAAANGAKFSSSALQSLAGPWLPYAWQCDHDGEGGLGLTSGEKARVRCQLGDVTINFVEYTSTQERDKVRIANLAKNIDAQQLTPGVGPHASGPTPSGKVTGDYLEYAYTVKSGDTDLTVAGLWWDDNSAPVGAYVLAYWKDKLGGSWAPLRDLWQRHA
jgi:hypothetical protein